MRVVALDASLSAVSVAAGTLAADGAWTLLACDRALRSAGHAETLVAMLASVVAQAGMELADTERVVVTHGPGGFTGVRAGVAAARALALATGCEAVGISTLDALAAEARVKGVGGALAVAVDARRGMVFFARYGQGQSEAEPMLVAIAEAARLAGGDCLVGSGAGLVAACSGGAALLPDLAPDAQSLAPLARSRPAAAKVRPLYLRPPDAKAQASFVLPRAQA
ncbi:MAG: tRNA (adenosine(37)-N6)-threonylcarbamoyltransferase complex dimerization subunit type 1 TsaB [Hyphomicrobiaceae bacterium]|nr:tRNA (adenosine(37)-N6)-threonylcarbamoyltransferase complex dimerization subunit type 1 TsaB [Hyphomicrobiaceae bacterium]